ncbi:glycosyltransferase [Paenibacillus sp. LMG 31459]|uniref:Glycosyltransferase n=1 Tax=Paenibacillus phytohabitans TaxID=2654978 RepID=A0ABX1YJ77_9BACL|nr:glycosyltransferase family 2 protein [Paenibacillus phytohabitans]NOU81087.1 glycosyltransferase [Paenibacillus phytohabitans]
MITISLCMIVRNEQATLERCIHSVQEAVDEIIIVDTGSTDSTKEIAGRWTPHVRDYKWKHHFADARNYSFEQAAMDYILWLDADDVLLPAELQKLLELKHSLSPDIDRVSMPYHCDFDEYGHATLKVRRVRLVRRSRNYEWTGAVHEDLSIEEGGCLDSDIVITHRKNHSRSDTKRNLRIYELLLSSGVEFTARDTLHYAMELHQHSFYEQAVLYYQQFIDSNQRTIEDIIHVCSKLADCYYHMGNRDKEQEWIFKSFTYDIPRPEFCCRLAYFFLEKEQFQQAVYWYKLAIESPPPVNPWAISNDVARTWLPHMQLGMCYYHLNAYELSYHHNKIASGYLPDDQRILNNLILLENEILKVKEQPDLRLTTFPC